MPREEGVKSPTHLDEISRAREQVYRNELVPWFFFFAVLLLGLSPATFADEAGDMSVSAYSVWSDGTAGFEIDPKLSFEFRDQNSIVDGQVDGYFGLTDWSLFESDLGYGAKSHLGHSFKHGLSIELDIAYQYDRDFDPAFSPLFAAVDGQHAFSADVGFQLSRSGYEFRVDAGTKVLLHEDLKRRGFSSFDRRQQNYSDKEISARLTCECGTSILPFGEVALVDRNYLLAEGRNFWGPEFILGLEIRDAKLQGQIGMIYAFREIDNDWRSIAGPYVDVTWQIDETTDVKITAGASLVQESSGDASLYPVYSGRVEIAHALNETSRIRMGVDVVHENHPQLDASLILSPELTVEWDVQPLITARATLAASYEPTLKNDQFTDMSAKIGLQFKFPD